MFALSRTAVTFPAVPTLMRPLSVTTRTHFELRRCRKCGILVMPSRPMSVLRGAYSSTMPSFLIVAISICLPGASLKIAQAYYAHLYGIYHPTKLAICQYIGQDFLFFGEIAKIVWKYFHIPRPDCKNPRRSSGFPSIRAGFNRSYFAHSNGSTVQGIPCRA